MREDRMRDAHIYPSFVAKLGRDHVRRLARLRCDKLGRLVDVGSQHIPFLSLARGPRWIPVAIELTTRFPESSRNEPGFQI
jgi:hypothetical protein